MLFRSARTSGTKPVVTTFFDEATFTATHVVHDPVTLRTAIIDPVLDFDQPSGRTSHASADRVIAHVEENGLTVDWLLETHAHADHLSAAPYLKKHLGGKTAIGQKITQVQKVFKSIFNLEPEFKLDGSQFDHLMADDEKIGRAHV